MLLAALAVLGCRGIQEEPGHSPSYTSIRDFFSLESDDIIISGHRGGCMEGYPENCLESFMKISSRMPVYYEVDPRFTKDSVVVLMHDEDISRSTDGTGLLSTLSYDQLAHLRLRDRSGKLTRFHVPTFDSVLEWSKGKVILNLDRKDVPVEIIAGILEKHGADNCIFTVQYPAQALEVLKYKNDALFSAFIGTEELFNAYMDQGLLDHIVVAYVQAASPQEDMVHLYSKIRSHGIRCMVSTVNEQDTYLSSMRMEYYQYLVDSHPDVIETDRPLEFIGLNNVRAYE
ncbi:MAG: glycerophosphodiester phosphodiesterase family protein [Bacteroidales bacterium]|nr:glycerophosphodiester phosphodiesterase family protein [Bacteroidales bacterium]